MPGQKFVNEKTETSESLISLCNLCVLCVSVVVISNNSVSEVAQRNSKPV